MRTLAAWLLLCLPVAADDLLVVTREGCPPCRQLKRDLLAHPEMYAPHRLSLVEGADAAARHRVDKVPTLIRLRDGREVARRVGYSRPSDVTDWLKNTD
jgi:thioredoxin-like negative regulator of GroEL